MQDQRPRRVLLVDDSPAILAILRRVIEHAAGDRPTSVRAVTSAGEALGLVQAYDPDLIVTDWHMPEVSGIELLQTLRQTGHSRVQVGFVTAETTPERVVEARSNGAAFVMHKPFDDGELMAAVRAAFDAAPPGAGHDAAPPVDGEALERLLRVALKKAEFRLAPCAPLRSEQLTPFVLCSHYGQGDDTPRVAALLDFTALCVVGVGTGAAALDAQAVNAAVARGRPDPEVVKRATTFMRVVCRLMRGHSDATPWRLLRSQVVSRTAGELDPLLAAGTGRTDMRLTVAGCTEARITFLALE